MNHYTPGAVADLMVSRIPAKNPQRIADICAGSGNLLLAARKRWPKVEAIGVDIDPLTGNSVVSKQGIAWTVGDGRQEVFKKRILGRCDVVLANPPFAKSEVPPPKQFLDIVRPLKAPHGRIINRLEASMLLANLAALAPQGFLGVIVPNGLLNAVCWQPLREFIVKQFKLIEVIHLPSVFNSADVESSILILRRQTPRRKNRTKMSVASWCQNRLRVFMTEKIPCEDLSERIDVKYFLNHNRGRKLRQLFLRDIPIVVRRGAYSASKARSSGRVRIVHSTNVTVDCTLDGYGLFLRRNDLKKGMRATLRAGDIVFVRVGKTIGRVGVVGKEENGALVSDCLFRIRLINGYPPEMLFNHLASEKARSYFDHVSRGTGAKYVTIEDLLSLPIPRCLRNHYQVKK